jgi:outer membrane protein W
MKKFLILIFALLVTLTCSKAHAQYYTVGLGPVGNIFAIDGDPQLSPGIGGYIFFDYRWSPQLSTQISIMVTTEDGKGPNNGDNGIEFLGMPTFDIKYYLISSVSRWDPYLMVGVGVYAVTEGSINNGTVAVGFGANVGVGCDFYFNDRWSTGLAASFRGIGLVDDTSGPNNGKAIFPVSLMGNVAYHF